MERERKKMKKKRIFIVDDEPEIVRFMEKVLVKNGYDVSSSTSAQLALEKIMREPFDVVITDLRMPDMSGMELLEKIKSSAVPVEVVVVTAHATIDTAVECLRKGAADYLIKPFEINEILATLEKAIAIGELRSRLVSMGEMDRLKDEFISTVTHELKTPLMAISGAIELLGMQIPTPANGDRRVAERRNSDRDVKKFLEIIDRQARKMKALVEDILDFARMKAGRMDIQKTPQSLAVIAGEVITELRPIAESKGVEIIPPTEDIVAGFDREQIKRVVTNLLTNAVKYNRPGGKVKLELFISSAGEPSMRITDEGIGVSSENIEKIFEDFFRVDQSMKRDAGGFGLGLSIAKKIVELHGGKITAESEGIGRGTAMTFTLPDFGMVDSPK
jgi:signal transduction histidine kinase